MRKLKQGDHVRIATDGNDDGWDGFEAVVESTDGGCGPWLRPLSSRPDGHGVSNFHWDIHQLQLVSETWTEAEIRDACERLPGVYTFDEIIERLKNPDLGRVAPKKLRVVLEFDFDDTTKDPYVEDFEHVLSDGGLSDEDLLAAVVSSEIHELHDVE